MHRDSSRFPSLSPGILWPLVMALTLIGCARIISTYRVFSQTYDESYHVAAGMEWLDKGVYLYERQHPPLARIAVALPLYLRGLRGHSLRDPIEEGNAILHSRGQYEDTLAEARSGNLIFFALSVGFLTLWANRWLGPWTALIAVALFTLLPPILGHAALATTDMAAVAGLLAVFCALSHWLENSSARASAMLGLALGFALLTKFSVIPFLAVTVLLIAVVWFVTHQPLPAPWRSGAGWQRNAANLLLITLTAAVVVWSVYRFELASVVTGHGYRPSTSALGRRLGPIADRMLDAHIPLGEFLGGVASVALHNRVGHDGFLLGAYGKTGWWYYFPVVLAVKTPLSFLALTLLGVPLAVRRLRSGSWQKGLPLLFTAGIFMSCMAARINLGVRHILPIYPMLSLIAADAIVAFTCERFHRLAQESEPERSFLFHPGVFSPLFAAMVALGCVLAVESGSAHPDYMAWFNRLAGSHPERVLADSNLDWGQDLSRLAARLKALHVRSLKLAYFGSSDLTQSDLPPFEQLKPQERATGWIACSAFNLMLRCAADGSYCWLQDQSPVERVGRSIFLYNVPGPQSDAAAVIEKTTGKRFGKADPFSE